MSFTYSDVDAGPDPTGAVAWQDRVDGWPQIKAYKRRILDLVAAAESVVDVGCGPGGAALSLGIERGIGVDRSEAMCTAAAARGATVCRADAHQLPFPDGSFGAAVADRVLQHVADPSRALGELVRVLRRGGRLVIADPDQETLVIHAPTVRQDLVDRVKALRRDVGCRNGRLVTTLPATLPNMGVNDISVEPFALSLTDPADAFGLAGWPRLWQAQGGFSNEDLLDWERGIEGPREGGFLYALIYFLVSGVRR